MADRPECFDSDDQWKSWRRYARTSSHSLKRYCFDCTAEYHARMIQEGRCRFPATVFVDSKEGIVGLSSEESGWFGAVTGHFQGTGKCSNKRIVTIASPEAVREELRRRKNDDRTAV